MGCQWVANGGVYSLPWGAIKAMLRGKNNDIFWTYLQKAKDTYIYYACKVKNEGFFKRSVKLSINNLL